MSGTYATPLRLEPGSAGNLGRFLLCTHGCAALVAVMLPVSLALRCLLAAWLLLSLLRCWPRHVTRSASSCIRAVTWREGRSCSVRLCDGTEQEVELGSSAFVRPWLVIIHFRGKGRRRRYLPLLPDMVDRDTFRRLRVRLRMELAHMPRSPRQLPAAQAGRRP